MSEGRMVRKLDVAASAERVPSAGARAVEDVGECIGGKFSSRLPPWWKVLTTGAFVAFAFAVGLKADRAVASLLACFVFGVMCIQLWRNR